MVEAAKCMKCRSAASSIKQQKYRAQRQRERGEMMQEGEQTVMKVRSGASKISRKSQRSAPRFGEGAGCPVPFSRLRRSFGGRAFPPRGNGAPGGARGLRGPLGFPLRSGNPRAADCRRCECRPVRLSGRGCESRPEARAPCDGGFARPATRTLRLPALHREPRCRRPAPCPAHRSRHDSEPERAADARSVREVFRAGITYFLVPSPRPCREKVAST